MKLGLAALAIAVLATALVRPELAARSAHLLLAASITVVLASHIVERFGDVGYTAPQPFVPAPAPEPPTNATSDVLEIVQAVERSRGVLPPIVRRHLRDAVAGRLDDDRGLQVERAADLPAIRAALSPSMWAILTDDEAAPDIPMAQLTHLLDELEAW